MSFRVGQPSHDSTKKCYTFKIHEPPPFQGVLVTPFEPDLKVASNDEFNNFVDEFLNQASPYFSKPLDKNIFMQRVFHSYSTDEDLSGSPIKTLSWIPDHIVFYSSRYEIRWILSQLERIEVSSGVPPDKPVRKQPVLTVSEQKRLRKKIRQARLKCALARLHVEQITEKYYRKYGNFDGLSDADSELSSDFEIPQNE
jgi:hypothetical protein